MTRVPNQDRKLLKDLPKDRLIDLFLLHIRNLWRVDGLYFLGIEKKFGTTAAAEIDADCWRLMGKLEARELKKALGIKGDSIAALMYGLQNTSWSLDQRDKETEVTATRGVYRVTQCRTQLTRIHKELGEFPCKNVRLGYLKSFAGEFNPHIEVKATICPPGRHPPDVWCEWEFTLKSKESTG